MKGAVQGVATTTASTPVKKAPVVPLLRGEALADTGEAAADLEQARQVEADDEEQIGDQQREDRRLELEAPVHLADAGADRHDRRPPWRRRRPARPPYRRCRRGASRCARGRRAARRRRPSWRAPGRRRASGSGSARPAGRTAALRRTTAARRSRRRSAGPWARTRDRAWRRRRRPGDARRRRSSRSAPACRSSCGGGPPLASPFFSGMRMPSAVTLAVCLAMLASGAPFGREEIDVADRVGLQALGLDDQIGSPDLATPKRAGHGLSIGTRLPRLVEQRACRAVGRLGRGSDRQAQV